MVEPVWDACFGTCQIGSHLCINGQVAVASIGPVVMDTFSPLCTPIATGELSVSSAGTEAFSNPCQSRGLGTPETAIA